MGELARVAGQSCLAGPSVVPAVPMLRARIWREVWYVNQVWRASILVQPGAFLSCDKLPDLCGSSPLLILALPSSLPPIPASRNRFRCVSAAHTPLRMLCKPPDDAPHQATSAASALPCARLCTCYRPLQTLGSAAATAPAGTLTPVYSVGAMAHAYQRCMLTLCDRLCKVPQRHAVWPLIVLSGYCQYNASPGILSRACVRERVVWVASLSMAWVCLPSGALSWLWHKVLPIKSY